MKISHKVNQLKGQEFIFWHTDIWLQKTNQSSIQLTIQVFTECLNCPCDDESRAQFHIFEGRRG